MTERAEHWGKVWTTNSPDAVSWYQPEPTVSLELIEACALAPDDPIVDVGAGASTLVDGLLARGHRHVTLVDVAGEALDVTRRRIGERTDARVKSAVSDVTRWQPPRTYALWHDRAVFHFLTAPADRSAYRAVLARALRAGGSAVIATFADVGPERCSGLPVARYSERALADELAPVLRMVESRRETHRTPGGAEQRFVYGRFVSA
jgi:hypothetical protein